MTPSLTFSNATHFRGINKVTTFPLWNFISIMSKSLTSGTMRNSTRQLLHFWCLSWPQTASHIQTWPRNQVAMKIYSLILWFTIRYMNQILTNWEFSKSNREPIVWYVISTPIMKCIWQSFQTCAASTHPEIIKPIHHTRIIVIAILTNYPLPFAIWSVQFPGA